MIRTEVWVLIGLALVVIFIFGVETGHRLKKESEMQYFDKYPSPLACHRDGNCGVEPCGLSEYKGTPLCR